MILRFRLCDHPKKIWCEALNAVYGGLGLEISNNSKVILNGYIMYLEDDKLYLFNNYEKQLSNPDEFNTLIVGAVMRGSHKATIKEDYLIKLHTVVHTKEKKEEK